MPQAVGRSIDDFVEAVAEAIGIVLRGQPDQPRLPHRDGGGDLDSAGAGGNRAVHVPVPHRPAQGVARHADSCARACWSTMPSSAVETMAVKLEQGFDRLRAAAFAYTSTAFPMLTGTLVTVSGFLPIALAQSATGEYTRSIFEVSAIALLLSWLAAVIVIPLLGYPDSCREHPTRRALAHRMRPTRCVACRAPRCLRHAVLPPSARLDRLVRRSPRTGARRDAGRCSSSDSQALRSCRSNSFRARIVPNCWSICACRKVHRSPRR